MVEIESIRVLGIDSDDLTHDLLTVKQGQLIMVVLLRMSIR